MIVHSHVMALHYLSLRECCTGSCPQGPHQTLQHEILPLRPEDQISAECQRDQVKTRFNMLLFKTIASLVQNLLCTVQHVFFSQTWGYQHPPEGQTRLVPREESSWSGSSTGDICWWGDNGVSHHLWLPGWSLPGEEAASFLSFW